MTHALLDHPWPLEAALDNSSPGFGVLLNFSQLIARHNLTPVPYVDQSEYDAAVERLNYRHAGVTAWFRFAYLCVRAATRKAYAVPVPEPPDPPLRSAWKQSLRDELENQEDWRRPQIIVPRQCGDRWPAGQSEIEIRCLDRPGAAPLIRSLVSLEQYESHPFALCDCDPWRHLEWQFRPAHGLRINHPCILPRPPCLNEVSILELPEHFAEARRLGWKIAGRHYYIPPEDYEPDLVSQARWRSGRAFPQRRHPENNRAGPVDYLGHIWAWDKNERHWDVQLRDGYMRVSHTGDELPKR